MAAILSRAGDTLDLLLWRDAGLPPSAIPAVLRANPALARLPAMLPPRTPVEIPAALSAPPTLPVVQLWT